MNLPDEIAIASEARVNTLLDGRSSWTGPTGLHWTSDGDSLTVATKRGRRRAGARVGPDGVTCSPKLFSHVMPWSKIAALSWDLSGRGTGCHLCVCEFGSPYPHPMRAASLDMAEVRALLAELRPFVEEMGAEVIDTSDAATAWWHRDPRSQLRPPPVETPARPAADSFGGLPDR